MMGEDRHLFGVSRDCRDERDERENGKKFVNKARKHREGVCYGVELSLGVALSLGFVTGMGIYFV